MTDYASFKHGSVTFPVPAAGEGLGGTSDDSLLRDLDPALFYMLEFYASVIETHIGARLIQEAVKVGAEWLTAAVAETVPINPEPYLIESHLRFPMLAAYRVEGQFEYAGQRKIQSDVVEVAYVLRSMTAAEAERLTPVLRGIVAILDNRTEQGFDPAYTPSCPAGTAGERVWSADRAGITRVEIVGVTYGAYQPTKDLFFPAVIMKVTLKERADVKVAEFEQVTGTQASLDLVDPKDGQTVAEDFVTTSAIAAPVLVGPCSPNSGSKAGGTPVTIPCTGLVVGRGYRVLFGGSDAANVTAVSTTSLTCVTPQADAYPTFAADVVVIDQDGQLSNTLSTAFTFTT